MKEINISFFQSPFLNESVQIPLSKVLLSIRAGNYSEAINEARFYYIKDKYKYGILKRKLPGVTFSGIFGEARKPQFLKSYTNLIVLDIDNLKKESVNEKKNLIFEDGSTFATWVSPSGYGLKILVGVSSGAELHKIAFDLLVKYYQEKYNVDIDLSGSDISRLCFCSYDEEILIKDDLAMFNVNDSEKSEIAQMGNLSEHNKNYVINTLHDNAAKALFDDERDRNKYSDREMISKIIKYLSKRKLSITENYDSWYRVALAIANTFTFNIGIKYFLNLCKLDGANHDEEKCISLLEYCYRNRRIGQINFSTIIYFAVQKGFSVNIINKPE